MTFDIAKKTVEEGAKQVLGESLICIKDLIFNDNTSSVTLVCKDGSKIENLTFKKPFTLHSTCMGESSLSVLINRM